MIDSKLELTDTQFDSCQDWSILWMKMLQIALLPIKSTFQNAQQMQAAYRKILKHG